MSGRTIRTFIAGMVLAVMLTTNSEAGLICEAIGRCWDKVATKMVKCHKATEEAIKDKCAAAKSRRRAKRGHCSHCR